MNKKIIHPSQRTKRRRPTNPWRNLELPQGKRTPLYRFFEILPAALSYFMVALLFILSWINPLLGSIYLLTMVAITLVKAVGVAFRTVQGWKVMKQAQAVDWRQRVTDLADPHASYERYYERPAENTYDYTQHLINLKKMAAAPREYPLPSKVYHAIIITVYNETIDTLEPTLAAIKKQTFPHKQIIITLAYEERGGEATEQLARRLQKAYRHDFYDFQIVKHPDGLKGEIVGKGPNLCCAGEFLAGYVRKKHLPVENVIITSLDADNRMDPSYLDYVAYEFIVAPDRQHKSFQPISLFTNNIWDAAAPMRVIAVSNSFFNTITTMRPHTLRNFASHSQPLLALEEMNFWSKRTIVEDGHQYWRSLFFFKGDYEVVPIRVPIGQDAVMSATVPKTLKAQFVQLRRWYYGASDVAYVGVRLFSRYNPMNFGSLFARFWRLLDGHVMLAVMAPIVAFGGWVPMLMNASAKASVGFVLPTVVGWVQTFAMVGLIATILTSMKMLPERPKQYKPQRSLMMVVQWVLMPVIAICYQSVAAFYSQTRLALGKYMEKFDVTTKVVKKAG